MSMVPQALQSCNYVSGAFTASGVSGPVRSHGSVGYHIEGTFSATLKLEFSADNGTTWFQLRDPVDGSVSTLTTAGTTPYFPCPAGTLWRINCTYTSGTVTYLLIGG